MPGGDFPTRKAVLDALLAGCIPVMFHIMTAHIQWPLHWGNIQTALDSMVYVPREYAMENITGLFSTLYKLSKDTVYMTKKRLAISRIGYRMQYNLPKKCYENNNNHN